MRSTISFLRLVALALVCSKAIAAPIMSDREAKTLVEENVKLEGTIPLGSFMVIPEDSHSRGKAGTISEKSYEGLVAWEKLGVISVTKDQKLENFKKGKEYSHEQWNEMLKYERLISKIVVKPTETGTQMIDPENPKRLKISAGNSTVTNVVKNEERKKGVDDYRLVMATLDNHWSPLAKKYRQLRYGKPAPEKSRVIYLFKWDPFSSKWKGVANDFAYGDEEFKTNNTAEALR